MQFPIQPVPIPQGAQPFQIPQRYDPAGIIMQAAALRQQRDLAQQELAQKGIENIMSVMHGAASLAEQKRQHTMENLMAQSTLELHQKSAESLGGLQSAEAQKALAEAASQSSMAKLLQVGQQGTMPIYRKGDKFNVTTPHPGIPDFVWNLMVAQAQGKQLIKDSPYTRDPLLNIVPSMANSLFPQVFPDHSQIDLAANAAGKIQAKKAAATFEYGAGVQTPVRLTNAILPAINLLEQKRRLLNDTDFQWINRVGMNMAAKTGSVPVQDYLTQYNFVQQAQNGLFRQTGTDLKLLSDIQALPASMTKAQAGKSLNSLKQDIIFKRNSMQGLPPDAKGIYDDYVPVEPKMTAQEFLGTHGTGLNNDQAYQMLQNARLMGMIAD